MTSNNKKFTWTSFVQYIVLQELSWLLISNCLAEFLHKNDYTVTAYIIYLQLDTGSQSFIRLASTWKFVYYKSDELFQEMNWFHMHLCSLHLIIFCLGHYRHHMQDLLAAVEINWHISFSFYESQCPVLSRLNRGWWSWNMAVSVNLWNVYLLWPWNLNVYSDIVALANGNLCNCQDFVNHCVSSR